jgi:chemotaxis protein CheX
MAGVEGLASLPITEDTVNEFKDCISSLVGLNGSYNGLVSLHMTAKMALRTAGSLLGIDAKEFNEDVADALGEITNIIAGSIKMCLSRGGLDVQLSTPSIINGNQQLMSLGNIQDQQAIRFASDKDSFIVSVVLEKN